MKIRSSIDIGTNSVLLLVAEFIDGRVKPLEELQRVPRLGRGVDENRKLSEESIKRVLDVLNEYHHFLSNQYPGSEKVTIVTATSAVRDALNRRKFMERVEKNTGWEIRLLSGDEEAITTFRGALSVLNRFESTEKIAVLDIGGGSTEIAIGNVDGLSQYISLDMGSVRFSERFFKKFPVKKESIQKLKVEAEKLLMQSGMKPDNIDHSVGVAGTVTSIASIENGFKSYQPEKLNNYRLSRSSVAKFVETFSAMTPEEIEKKHPLFLENRGDVILGGLVILLSFMNWAGMQDIIISTGGIRHGILMEE